MNDTMKAIIEFIKGLMQPLITIAMIVIFVGYSGAGKFPIEFVIATVGGILLFWFGYTAIKNFTYTGTNEAPASKAPPKASGWVSPAAYVAPPQTASTAENWGIEDEDDTIPLDVHYANVVESIEDDGLDVDNASMSSRMYSYLAAHEDEFSEEDKEEWIADGVKKSASAFEEVAGTDAPQSWEDAKDYNKWWREHSLDCKVNKSTAKPLFMTCRSWLKLQDTGEW